MRRLILLLCCLFLAAVAKAQLPGGNVYLGYSYFNFNPTFSADQHRNFNGWDAALEVKFLPFISGVAEVGGNYGMLHVATFCPVIPGPCPIASPDTRVHTFLFGPRISASVGKFRPFAEGMVGAGHTSLDRTPFTSPESDTSFATALGGGLDYKLIKGIAWRFQGDYLHTRFFDSKQNNFRFTTGLVLRF